MSVERQESVAAMVHRKETELENARILERRVADLAALSPRDTPSMVVEA